MPVAPQTESPQPAEGCYGCCPTLVAEVERLRAELAKACTDCGSPDRGGRALKQDNEQDDVYRGLRGRKSSGTYRLSLSHKRSTIEQIKRVMQESLTTALLFEPLDARTIQKAETLLSEALSPQWLATQGVHEAMIRAAGYASENRLDVHLYYQFEDDPTTRVITYTLLPGRSEIHV